MGIPTNRLKELRNARGWTQADIARIMDVDQSTISSHESGRRLMDTTMVHRYAKLFGLAQPLEMFHQIDPETGEIKTAGSRK